MKKMTRGGNIDHSTQKAGTHIQSKDSKMQMQDEESIFFSVVEQRIDRLPSDHIYARRTYRGLWAIQITLRVTLVQAGNATVNEACRQ